MNQQITQAQLSRIISREKSNTVSKAVQIQPEQILKQPAQNKALDQSPENSDLHLPSDTRLVTVSRNSRSSLNQMHPQTRII